MERLSVRAVHLEWRVARDDTSGPWPGFKRSSRDCVALTCLIWVSHLEELKALKLKGGEIDG